MPTDRDASIPLDRGIFVARCATSIDQPARRRSSMADRQAGLGRFRACGPDGKSTAEAQDSAIDGSLAFGAGRSNGIEALSRLPRADLRTSRARRTHAFALFSRTAWGRFDSIGSSCPSPRAAHSGDRRLVVRRRESKPHLSDSLRARHRCRTDRSSHHVHRSLIGTGNCVT